MGGVAAQPLPPTREGEGRPGRACRMLRSLWSFLKRHKKKCLVLGTFLGGECPAAGLRGGEGPIIGLGAEPRGLPAVAEVLPVPAEEGLSEAVLGR